MHHNQYESISQAKGNGLVDVHSETTPTPPRPSISDTKQEALVATDLRFFTVQEIADLLQMKRERVYEAVRLGLVPAVHIGRQVRIEQKAFVEWVRDGGQTFAAGWRHQAS